MMLLVANYSYWLTNHPALRPCAPIPGTRAQSCQVPCPYLTRSIIRVNCRSWRIWVASHQCERLKEPVNVELGGFSVIPIPGSQFSFMVIAADVC